MAITRFCTSCGWKGSVEIVSGWCPECGSFTQHYQSVRDVFFSDLRKVVICFVLFVTIAVSWTFLTYPYQIDGGNDFTARFHMEAVSLLDSQDGTNARFSLRNDSRWEIARVEVTVRLHSIPQHTGSHPGPIPIAGPQKFVAENLAPDTEQFLDFPVEGRKSRDLFGWTAKIESFDLPQGYWNRRLKSAITARLVGMDENIPNPFPQNFPIQQEGK